MAEYRRFPYGDWWHDSWSPSVSAEFQLSAGRYHTSWSGVKNNNNRAGHVCPYLRKEIHYVLFKKHKLLDVRFIFFFYFFIMGAYFPFFPIWLMTSTISAKVIRVLFLPLFLCLAIIPTAVWSAF